MDSVKLLRRILMLLTVVVILAVLLIIFQLTDFGYRAFMQLKDSSPWLLGIYLAVVAVVALAGLYLVFKIWTLGRSKPQNKKSRVRPSLESVQARLEQAREQGFEVEELDAQLAALPNEQAQELEVAFFGKISTGKSSLIRSLIPDARVETSVIGGSTGKIERFYYQAAQGLSLQLLDMPGTHQAQTVAHLAEEVLAAARRVHIVCYVLDQDITASDKASIMQLNDFGKPLVVVLNKISRYKESERRQLLEHIRSEIPADAQLVAVDSIHAKEVQIQAADGSLRKEERLLGGDVHALVQLFADLEARRGELNSSQRQALIELADDTLSQRLAAFRRERGKSIVKTYSRKAMFGGVAAVGPGTDVIIQGYLGLELIKSLTKLYGVSTQDVDLQGLLEAAGGKVRSQLTVMLALTGNVCKAFPGIGTVLGGASHAVAYGLIFESLGQAIVDTLDKAETQFTTQNVLNAFEQQMQRDMEKRAVSLIKTALGEKHGGA